MWMWQARESMEVLYGKIIADQAIRPKGRIVRAAVKI